jgi:hypothetical protein
MKGLDLSKFANAVGLAPFGETTGSIEVGLARVAVVELRGEKVADALGGFRGRREEGEGNTGPGGGGEELATQVVLVFEGLGV